MVQGLVGKNGERLLEIVSYYGRFIKSIWTGLVRLRKGTSGGIL
jgi:hypothetical protein